MSYILCKAMMPFISNLDEVVTTDSNLILGVVPIILIILCISGYCKGFFAGMFSSLGLLSLGFILSLGLKLEGYYVENMYMVDVRDNFRLLEEYTIPLSVMDEYNFEYTEEMNSDGKADWYMLNSLEGMKKYLPDYHKKECPYFVWGASVYSMNDKTSDKYLCPSWVCNPMSIMFIPGFFSLPFFLMIFFAKDAIRF